MKLLLIYVYADLHVYTWEIERTVYTRTWKIRATGHASFRILGAMSEKGTFQSSGAYTPGCVSVFNRTGKLAH